MATGGISVEISDKLLECVKCKQRFQKEDRPPRLLQCLHNLCTPCLKNILKGNKGQCPECRTDIDQQEKDIPTDHTKENLVDFQKSFRGTDKKECDFCESHKAVIRCDDCDGMYLCDSCSSKMHRKKKTHNPVKIAGVTRPDQYNYTLHCQKQGHDNCYLKHYCKTCEEALCSECLLKEEHKEKLHDINDVPSTFEEHIKGLTEESKKLNETIHNIDAVQDRIAIEKSKIRKAGAAAECDVTFYFNRCIQMLEKRKLDLMREIDKKCEEKLKLLKDEENELQSIKSSLSYSGEFLNHSKYSQNRVAFLQIAPTIDKRLRSLAKVKYDLAPRVNGDVKFILTKVQNSSNSLCDLISTHGSISSPKMYHPQCELMTVPLKDNEEEVKIKIILKNYLGEVENDDSIIVSGVFTDRSTVTDTTTAFTKNKPGVYTSLKTTKKSDGIDIKILINDNPFLAKQGKDLDKEDKSDIPLESHSYEEANQVLTADMEWNLSDPMCTPKDTRYVVIDCFCETDTTESDIKAYFSNTERSGGRDVDSVEINAENGFCIITFKDTKVVKEVLRRKQHKIKGHDITIRPFYRTPRPLFIHVDMLKLSFVRELDVRKSDFEDVLRSLHAEVDWGKSQNFIQVSCRLTTKMNEYEEMVKYWAVLVTQRTKEYFDMISVVTLQVEKETVDKFQTKKEPKVNIEISSNQRSLTIKGYRSQFECVLDQIQSTFSDHRHPTIQKTTSSISSGITVRHVTHTLNRQRCLFLQTVPVQNTIANNLSSENVVCAFEFENDLVEIYFVEKKSTCNRGCVQCIIERTTAFKKVKGTFSKGVKKEIGDINAKTNGIVNISRIKDDEMAVCATTALTGNIIAKHLEIMLQNADGGITCKAHFLTKTQHTISVFRGHITKLDTEAVVCSSDKKLQLGIGVGKDLVEKGGNIVQEKCIEYLKNRQEKVLADYEVFCGPAGQLKFKKVIHIPGKKWTERSGIEMQDRKEYMDLVQLSLMKVNELKFKSVSLPALCCGNNEYPVDAGVVWMVDAIYDFLNNIGPDSNISQIFLCDLNDEAVKIFVETLQKKYQPIYKKKP